METTQEINRYLQDPKTIKRLRYVFFRFCKGTQEFEDFYHDYAVHLLSGHGRNQCIDQFFIDWLRRITKFNRLTREAPKFSSEGLDNIISNGSHYDHGYISLVKDIIKKYKGRIRIILILYYIYGLDMKEIGLILNLSDSRISQILTRVKSGVRITDKSIVDEIDSIDQPEIDKLKKENQTLRSKLIRSFRTKVAQNSRGSDGF